MCSGCTKSEARVAYATHALRHGLRTDGVLVAGILQLLWGQLCCASLGAAFAPVVPGGLLLSRAMSVRTPLAFAILLSAAAAGLVGMRMVRPAVAATETVTELLAGARTQRVELVLRIESAVERRGAGAGRARVSTVWRDQRLALLASFPELPWIGRGYLSPGDRLRVVGKLRGSAGEGIFDFGEYLRRRGLVGSVSVVHVDAIALGEAQLSARESLLRELLDRHPLVDGFGVLVAGAFGVGDLLSEEVVELFRETGLTHLLVVSGYHVGVIFTAIYAGVAWGARLFPGLIAVVPLPTLASLGALLLGSAYVAFVGANLTTARALLSAGFMLGARVFARAVAPRRTLLLVLLLCACCWPGSAFEAGFQLTFAALFGLYYGGVWGAALLPQRTRAVSPVIASLQSALYGSVGATLFTTPVMLLWFSTFSPLALLFNLLAGGVFSLLFILLAGILFFVRACGVTVADYGIEALVVVAEYYLSALSWLADLVANSPAHYRELEPPMAKSAAASCGVLLLVGIVLGERFLLKERVKDFATGGLKN